ncbi:hypothetical protein EIN_025470 [Entamoeba invadens IP1]|uniref:hypothetical protein n=1 Tax=Entamoeba invadens IP1 TaxID=370355 RepID=UPI0002C3F11C|nr:hypothetical protein EIN_025470 [Entamoeba invadens IP1]ELP90728.1 hypothetical protein EIN_025470 [Entamoeba invadens IP1]|eukprot:XP_004257499.1 hypothetical protein EIN_025470 [Entamoeba invadens IP1]
MNMMEIDDKQTPQYQRQILQQSVEEAKAKGTLVMDIGEYSLSKVELLLNDTNDDTLESLLMKGIDLSVLGIDLTSPTRICSSFTTPFPTLKNSIPNYYFVDSKELTNPEDRANSFKNELILFYMFYVMVGEEAQFKAAKTLMDKKWRFSNKFGKWVTQAQSGWMEFDVSKWSVQPALSFNPAQADFMSL